VGISLKPRLLARYRTSPGSIVFFLLAAAGGAALIATILLRDE